MIVDNFAGGGGASTGIEHGLGRHVDVAINHDPEAVAMHRINHPRTRHYCESVWAVDPEQVTAGRQVELGWFSPDCTFHSKARGGKPFRDRDTARRRRGLAWLVTRWAKTRAAPRVIMLENVEEFADWGPLLPDGKICPIRRGQTFRRWHRELENLGYRIDMREMRACDYGAPTTRKRLFVIMRRDGGEIVFPEATHGELSYQKPYRTAAECIDWSIPCPSIFTRDRPLADATMRRIARGVMRYVVNDPQPFIVAIDNQSSGASCAWPASDPLRTVVTENRFALVAPSLVTMRGTSEAHVAASGGRADEPLRTISAGGNHHALIVPTLIQTGYGERPGQAPRVPGINKPLGTVVGTVKHAVVAAFLAKHYGGVVGHGLTRPIGTVTTVDHHSLVMAFLLKFYGTDQDPRIGQPLHTITTKDRFGLVMVHGEPHYIADIGMRMLAPHELFAAQGFPSDYVIDRGEDAGGSTAPLTKSAQVRMCGNSVSPPLASALVRANLVDQCERRAA